MNLITFCLRSEIFFPHWQIFKLGKPCHFANIFSCSPKNRQQFKSKYLFKYLTYFLVFAVLKHNASSKCYLFMYLPFNLFFPFCGRPPSPGIFSSPCLLDAARKRCSWRMMQTCRFGSAVSGVAGAEAVMTTPYPSTPPHPPPRPHSPSPGQQCSPPEHTTVHQCRE